MSKPPLPARSVSPEHLRSLQIQPRPAILLDPEYRILAANQAYRDHYPRPLHIGQDQCFRVSHGYTSPCDQNGEQCPLRQALKSKQRERVFHIHHGPKGQEHVDVALTPLLGQTGAVEAFLEVIDPIEEVSAHAGGTFVGSSAAFVAAVELIQRGSKSEVPILLLGESGTGKELAARAIHDASPRRAGPFVVVECSGLGDTLFESELFGHARGAFTGAHARKRGLVQEAAKGTLFLDEIGDVPLSLQVKLLRLLESSTYRAVGDLKSCEADFRLVCATHRNLDQMVTDGLFRQDLYFRINAFPVPLPPLRERRQDIALLSKALLKKSHKRLAADALAALMHHEFPGNIRQLKNLLERAVLLSDGPEIHARHLPPNESSDRKAHGEANPQPAGAQGSTWPWGDQVLPLAEVERRYLRWASEQVRGDRRQLAAQLGLSERTLYRKLPKD